MYVCLCKGVTDGRIRKAATNGCRRFADLQKETDVATQCGRCRCVAEKVFLRACDEQRGFCPKRVKPLAIFRSLPVAAR